MPDYYDDQIQRYDADYNAEVAGGNQEKNRYEQGYPPPFQSQPRYQYQARQEVDGFVNTWVPEGNERFEALAAPEDEGGYNGLRKGV
jgi:hypothetical protein